MGEWGVGKTSLLNKLVPSFGEYGAIIQEDIPQGPGPAQVKAIYAALFQELSVKAGVANKIVIDVNYDQPHMIRKRLANLVSKLWNSKEGQIAIVILDNVERSDPDFLASLKDVFQRLGDVAPHFMLILAGRSLPGAGEQASDPIARFFQTIHIGPLNDEEALCAIQKPIEYYTGFSIERDAATMIAERAAGHPYFLKQICHEVYRISAGEGVINLEWIERRWPEVEVSLASLRFNSEYDDLPDGEKYALHHASLIGVEFSRSGIPGLKPAALDTALHRLKKRDLIRLVSRGEYKFYHPLFRSYVKTQALAAGVSTPVQSKPPSSAVSLEELIAHGEGSWLEFKETLEFNVHKGAKDRQMVDEVLKTIAAFSNSHGGTLLIGVADDGGVKGIERDMCLLHSDQRNHDGFSRKLHDLVRSNLIPPTTGRIEVSFKSTDSGEVCIVKVPRHEEVTYLKDGTLFVRDGPRSQAIKDPVELEAYIRSRPKQR